MNGDLDAPEPREDEGGATEIGTEGLSPKDFEQIEFATTDGQRPAAVVATFSNPAFPTESAPASLLAGFISEVRGLFRAIGSGFEPQVYQVSATNSMSVYFGEPPVVGAQHELEIGSAANVGHAVADMIGLQGDELFSRAVRLGESSKAYMSFVRFTAQNDVTVRWSVGTTRVVVLPPKRAAAQYERLVAPPVEQESRVVVNGSLYRVILDGKDASVGIRLFPWSLRPPGFKQQKLLVDIEDKDVIAEVRDGLVGEPVEAEIALYTPTFGSTFDLTNVRRVIVRISRGPSEASKLGDRSLEDDLDNEES